MIDLASGYRVWVILLAGFGAAAARPPVEAVKPRPAAEAKTGETAPTAEGPNSGGPGSSAQEGGAPAPAAEPAASAAADARPRKGIWLPNRGAEQPKPLMPEIAGDAKPVTPAATVRPADPLDRQVDEALDVTARRVLTAESLNPKERPHTPWQIGHGMLAFRRDYLVKVRGEKVNAYEWVANNPVYRARVKRGKDAETTVESLNWFYLTPYGARPQRFTGEPYEFEGHPNQFLAFFALARIPLDFKFTVQGRQVTYGDMLKNAKMEVNDREEVAWDLWAFAYYFDVDEQWRNAKGEPWNMERLVSTTLAQFSPQKSPCGGCHALFALASARNAYFQTKGARLTGAWTQAHYHLEKHIELARQMQNRDGSFSGDYFKGRKYIGGDPSKRISTTGHTLEFLMMALKQERLKEQWVRNAVNRLSHDLIQYQADSLEVGGMYHAAHALVLYRERTRPQFATKTKAITPAAAKAIGGGNDTAPAAAVRVTDAPKAEAPKKLEPAAKAEEPRAEKAEEPKKAETTSGPPQRLEQPRPPEEPKAGEPKAEEPKAEEPVKAEQEPKPAEQPAPAPAEEPKAEKDVPKPEKMD